MSCEKQNLPEKEDEKKNIVGKRTPIEILIQKSNKMVIVISGPSGSGKSQTALLVLTLLLQKYEAQLLLNAQNTNQKLLEALLQHTTQRNSVLVLTTDNVLNLPTFLRKRIHLLVFQEFSTEEQTTCCELGCLVTLEQWKSIIENQLAYQEERNKLSTTSLVCVALTDKQLCLTCL